MRSYVISQRDTTIGFLSFTVPNLLSSCSLSQLEDRWSDILLRQQSSWTTNRPLFYDQGPTRLWLWPLLCLCPMLGVASLWTTWILGVTRRYVCVCSVVLMRWLGTGCVRLDAGIRTGRGQVHLGFCSISTYASYNDGYDLTFVTILLLL